MDKHLTSLIDSVIEQKKLQFSVTEVSFDNSLFEENILILESDKISIANYNLIIYPFLNSYKEKFDFEISEEFEDNVNFIKKIKEHFYSNGYVQDYHTLEKVIWKTIIKESNTKFQCSFNDYLNLIELENKPEGIYNFIDAYSEELPYLKITACNLYNNALKLLEISKSDAHYNIPFGNILNGIKNKCKIDYEIGLILLTKSLILEADKENLLSVIISGLYDNKKKEFYNLYLEDLIIKGNKLNTIFFGLSNISVIENDECLLFIDLIEKYKNNESLTLSLISLVFTILKSNNTNYHNFCFEELKSNVENEISAYYILNNLNQIDKCEQEKTEVIIKLINQSYFSIEKYINPINTAFWYIKEFESFKKVVLTIIEKRSFESFIKIFKSSLDSANHIELDKFTIELLTDNQSSKRFIGLEIFDELSTYNPYKFTFDILALPSFIQYKLWVSLTQDFHEPKKRLIALLPLLESNSDWVKTSFLCKLEEISEDYGGLVENILENNIEYSTPNSNYALERIRNYIEVFHNKYVTVKYPIPELNPYHTHYKDIKLFNELFSKKMNESINKGATENSLLGILGVSTIQLSKGGGWKFGAKNNISQLGKIESSFTMPRSYFINPNEFELEKGFLNTEDWNDEEFLEIKNFLENE